VGLEGYGEAEVVDVCVERKICVYETEERETRQKEKEGNVMS
jgi:hypothetical protein